MDSKLEILIKDFPWKPHMDVLLVLPDKEPEAEKPSILTRDVKEKSHTPRIIFKTDYQFATVIAVGPGRRFVDESKVGYMGSVVKPGDRVCIGRGNAEFRHEDTVLEIISETDIRLIQA